LANALRPMSQRNGDAKSQKGALVERNRGRGLRLTYVLERRYIVIGCSHGCVQALLELVSEFDPAWHASIFITLHVGSYSVLPEVLSKRSQMPIKHAEHGEAIRSGAIYIAPPDHHMCIGKHRVSLSRGPRENWCRPAIDPMFRSAAEAHGASLIGLLMTGMLYDGASGLLDVHRHGGITIVQDPDDAVGSEMPMSALKIFTPDFVVPLREIGALIGDILVPRPRACG